MVSPGQVQGAEVVSGGKAASGSKAASGRKGGSSVHMWTSPSSQVDGRQIIHLKDSARFQPQARLAIT